MTSTAISLRLPEATTKKVRMIAHLEQRSFAETLKILTEEAVKMREFPDIVTVSGPTGRRAKFVGGPDVWEILEPFILAGNDRNALRQSYPEAEEAMLQSAIRYYELYPDEIEARIALNRSE
ncbi:MAG: hypothetical protein ACRDFS_08160 [Chloroflexota bacterium]